MTDDRLIIHTGNCLEVLATMPDQSVDCAVSSPPYWGLRDYKLPASSWPDGWIGSHGLEPTVELYVQHEVLIWREVRRVLKDDGTAWVNLGDCYNGTSDRSSNIQSNGDLSYRAGGRGVSVIGLKPKDMVGQPWRVALALQADGWYLRCDIIWAKPNPMPESCTDRPTKSHEYIFLLSKSERYYYDQEAINEPCTGNAHSRGNGVNPKAVHGTVNGWDSSVGNGGHSQSSVETKRLAKSQMASPGPSSRMHIDRDVQHSTRPKKSRQNESFAAACSKEIVLTRNKRSVWTVPTKGTKECHFATFPPDLIKPCILAGCAVGGTVLDPFFGSGTSGLVALELGRKCIGIELNPDYVKIAQGRCNVTPGLNLS